MSSSDTRYNKPRITALSLFTDLGHKEPRDTHDRNQFDSDVLEIASTVLNSFGITETQRDALRAIPMSPRAASRSVSDRIRDMWATACFVLGNAQHFADEVTITQVCTEITGRCQDLFQRYGLSSQAISSGLTQAARELATSAH